MRLAVALFLAAVAPIGLHAQSQWVLTQSTLTWHVVHPMHEVDGTSHAAKMRNQTGGAVRARAGMSGG